MADTDTSIATVVPPIDLQSAVLPPLVRALKNLRAVLAKGEAHARAQGWEDTRLTEARLAPDMLPLKNQVYIATDTAKFAVARTAPELAAPAFPDTQTTFAELLERLDRTLDFLRTVPPGAMVGKEAHPVTLKRRTGELNTTGRDYLLGFVLPNLYFHATTAYNILRHNGVAIGKADYLGWNG